MQNNEKRLIQVWLDGDLLEWYEHRPENLNFSGLVRSLLRGYIESADD